MSDSIVIKRKSTGKQYLPVTNVQLVQGLPAALAKKQDKLISGVNIKTVNNQSLLGPGNITIEGGGGGVSPTVTFRVEGTRLIITTSSDSNIRVEGTKLILI